MADDDEVGGDVDAGEISEEQAEAILADAVAHDAEQSSNEDTEQSSDDLKAELERWKKLARKHENNARHNSSAAKKLQEIEDAKKSTEDKLNEQLSSLQAELDGYKAREVAQKAASDAGLPASMARFVSSTDPDEAANQAKELAKHLKSAEKEADFRQGARQPAKKPQSVDAWLRQQAGRT